MPAKKIGPLCTEASRHQPLKAVDPLISLSEIRSLLLECLLRSLKLPFKFPDIPLVGSDCGLDRQQVECEQAQLFTRGC